MCFHGNKTDIRVIGSVFSGNDQQKVYVTCLNKVLHCIIVSYCNIFTSHFLWRIYPGSFHRQLKGHCHDVLVSLQKIKTASH